VNRRRRAANSRSREEATQVARKLIQSAASTARDDLDLAREQAALARRIMLKFNIRYPWQLKRFYCHGCKGLILPGVNARVRLGPGKMLLVTCKDCGRVNRKRLRQA
jgi:ribonuclease P protein subunit RPR2